MNEILFKKIMLGNKAFRMTIFRSKNKDDRVIIGLYDPDTGVYFENCIEGKKEFGREKLNEQAFIQEETKKKLCEYGFRNQVKNGKYMEEMSVIDTQGVHLLLLSGEIEMYLKKTEYTKYHANLETHVQVLKQSCLLNKKIEKVEKRVEEVKKQVETEMKFAQDEVKKEKMQDQDDISGDTLPRSYPES